jgi:hypothetical protein
MLPQEVIVPNCGDGEYYVLNKTSCYQCRDGTFALRQVGASGRKRLINE